MTIERTKVEGRDCTVAYLDDDWNPMPKDKATMVKVIFDDGGMIIGHLEKPPPKPDE